MGFARSKLRAGAVAVAVAIAAMSAPAIADAAAEGGVESGSGAAPPPSSPEAPPPSQEAPPPSCTPSESGGGMTSSSGTTTCPPAQKARLVHGEAVPPPEAPPAVKAAIAAANTIRYKPYIWGGGHGRWQARGYDCSGAVSFALHGGGLLGAPLVSGQLAHWGRPGRGRWITIYANATHVYAVIAGRRWDTVGDPPGISGPRWHPSMRGETKAGFIVRHPAGY